MNLSLKLQSCKRVAVLGLGLGWHTLSGTWKAGGAVFLLVQSESETVEAFGLTVSFVTSVLLGSFQR